MTKLDKSPSYNSTKTALDRTYLALSQDWSLWEQDLSTTLSRITEIISSTLNVTRVSIWILREQQDGFNLLDLFDSKMQEHSQSIPLLVKDFPGYFDALMQDRVIDAVDAHSDYRTREFSQNYLTPLGIGAMLDATLRKTGQMTGVLCLEHVGGQRLWNEHEKRFTISVADLISQRLIYEDIRVNEVYFRELSAFQQAIFNSASFSIISTSTDGVIGSFNDAACRLLGYAADEVIGKKIIDDLLDPRELQSRAVESIKTSHQQTFSGIEVLSQLASNGTSEQMEWNYVAKNGSRVPVTLSISTLNDESAAINGYLFIASDISDRVETRRALLEEENRYRTIVDNTGDSIFLMKEEAFVDCNPATLQMFGCTREQILHQPPYRFSPHKQPDGRDSRVKALEKIEAAFTGETQFFEWVHCKYDGTPFDAEVTLNKVEIQGQPHLLASVRDISERKVAQRELELSKEALERQNKNLALINELSGRLHGSLSIAEIFDETIGVLNGLTESPGVALYLMDSEHDRLNLKNSYGFDEDVINSQQYIPLHNSLTGLALETGEIQISADFTKDDRISQEIKQKLLDAKIYSAIIIPLKYQQQYLGSINLVYYNRRELTDVEMETLGSIGKTISLSLMNSQHMQDLEKMAHHDSLTGLANRLLLHEHFATKLLKKPETKTTLMLLDLDRFKEINDTLGHHIGDRLLQQIGPRLQPLLSQLDALLCRLGGDEFTVLIYDELDEHQRQRYAEIILENLRKPYAIDSMILEIDASIGVAVSPVDGEDSHALLRSADVAMYEAKRRGGGIVRYDKSIDKHTPERLALIADLGSGIRQQQLCLHYQPKIDTQEGEIKGFEALVRWDHPQLGLLYPDKFIHLAELSDSIHLLTRAVLASAISQQKQWTEKGYRFSVAVNLSARNLIDDQIVNYIESLLNQHSTETGMLELEITETALMQDPDGAATLLNRLSSLGVRISIDDFGTGYSSLSYLRKLPIDALKIDREFVCDMLSNEQDSIIVRSTIALAHNLNLKVIAEGVEDQDTLQMLKKMGCDIAQGYHISKPMDWERIDNWLASAPYLIRAQA